VPVPEITVDELEDRLAAGAPVVDVREPDEYDEGHVPGAQLIPLGQLPDRLGELPAHRPLLMICRTGGRSLQAAEFLVAHGIDAANVVGGTMGWLATGREVVVGPSPS
jgi:rhodanese-related sulfurtransferase